MVVVNAIPATFPLQIPAIVELRVQAISLQRVNIKYLSSWDELKECGEDRWECTHYEGCDCMTFICMTLICMTLICMVPSPIVYTMYGGGISHAVVADAFCVHVTAHVVAVASYVSPTFSSCISLIFLGERGNYLSHWRYEALGFAP